MSLSDFLREAKYEVAVIDAAAKEAKTKDC